jgi:hypothetical protein
MINRFTWILKISSREKLRGSKCIMSSYKNWFVDYKHQGQKMFNDHVSSRITPLSKDYNYMNEEDHAIIA